MSTTYHSLRAWLHDNPLTENPNDFIARVISERSLNVGSICTAAVSRGGADISAAAMEHGVNLFLKEMAYQLCDGYSVNTGYFTASPQIRGVFDSPNEAFNPEKHSLHFQFNQGEVLRAELANIRVEIQGVADTALNITQVTDVKSGSINSLLTAGHILKIAGHKLKIVGDNPDNGVYFIHQTTEERTKVDVSDLVTNNPSELIILVPALPAGSYRLEVQTQYSASGSTMLKEPRRALFDKILTLS